MHFIGSFIDIVLHLDRHLAEFVVAYSLWIYGVLFLVIFCETGLVVTPFLPGDSLLFALGALAAMDSSGTLHIVTLWLMLAAAAVLGNEVNFRIGRFIGPPAFNGSIRFLKKEYLLKTQAFYARYGGKTIVLSRFMPIIRTFAPFVAGVGHMQPLKFFINNLCGGIAWVSLFIWGGYLFGNVPVVKRNFGLVTIGIVILSVTPIAWSIWKSRHKK